MLAMDKDSAAIAQKNVLEGFGKGLRVIEAFNDDHPRLTPTQVADIAGMSRTAARRYLLSLCHFGYAGTDGKLFWLAPRVLRLGQSYLASARLPRLVKPFLQRLSVSCGETVNLSVLDGHEVVYLAHSPGPRMVSIGFHAGTRVPAHLVSPGYVILASRPDDELMQWIGEHEFAGYTPHTVVTPEAYLAQIEMTRRLGYSYTQQQLDIGLRGLSVPVRDRKGRCLGAIGLTLQLGASSRDEVVNRLVPLLLETQQMLQAAV